MLADPSKEINVTISQLILERGHTMMEVDSVHAMIERNLIEPLYAPSDFYTAMKTARRENPYKLTICDHSFFRNFENRSSNFKPIRPGTFSGDSTVQDIRSLLYSPNGDVFYKLRHIEEWKLLPRRRSDSICPLMSSQKLYKCSLGITEAKWNDLQSMKTIMPRDYHPFYDSLKKHS